MARAIQLDGTTLEGGGQLLRLALSLSSLTMIPVHITHIRGKRGAISAGRGGGLKPAHLAAVEWLAKATAADTQGMEIRSTDLLFQPTRWMVEDDSNVVWKDIYDGGRLVRRESHIPMSSAGSITLILQAIFPYILYLPSPVPLRITIQGGTNVSKSPSVDYISQVLLPLLSVKLGIQPVQVNIHKRGWSVGRSDVGSVTFDITPIQNGSVLPAFHFTDRGEVEKVHISVIAPDDGTRELIKAEALKQLGEILPKAKLLSAVDEDSRSSQRIYLLLVAETLSGFRLGRDCLSSRKAKSGPTAKQESVRLVSSVVKEFQKEVSSNGCVDEYLEDQLVVFQALAHGRFEVEAGKGRTASLHTQTARWVAERILGVTFEEGGSCDGVSFRIGEGLKSLRDTGQQLPT